MLVMMNEAGAEVVSLDNFEVSVTTSPGAMIANFDDLERTLTIQMTAYDNLPVTAENVKERRDDVATLRKIRKAIEDKRKAAKNEYEKPLKEFEGNVKRMTAIIDKQIDTINKGITQVEDARKAEKQKVVTALYEKEVGELAPFLPYERIKKDRWLNKTCTENEIIFDLQEMTSGVKGDLQAIRELGSDIEDKLIDTYRRNGNSIVHAMKRHNEYMQAKADAQKILAEAQKRLAEEQKAEEIRKAQEAAVKAAEQPAPASPQEPPQKATESPTAAAEWTITIIGDADIEAARAWVEMFGINYREE